MTDQDNQQAAREWLESIERIAAEMRARADVHDSCGWRHHIREWADRLSLLRNVPDGYALVPTVPTVAMNDAAAEVWLSASPTTLGVVLGENIYRAMISAAPPPPDSGEK